MFLFCLISESMVVLCEITQSFYISCHWYFSGVCICRDILPMQTKLFDKRYISHLLLQSKFFNEFDGILDFFNTQTLLIIHFFFPRRLDH